MEFYLEDRDRLREEEYEAMLDALGGQYSIWERWKIGGTGIGGLTLLNIADLPLPRLHNESWICSFEQLREGFIFRCTNSKKWYIAPIPFDHIDTVFISDSRNIQLELTFETPLVLRFVFNAWACRQVLNYFNKVPGIDMGTG